MGTLGELKTRIADDLTRTDLTSQIANAISDAIAEHERERFWFNQTRTLTFPTVASQAAYGSSDQARIPYFICIDALFLISGTSIYPLRKRDAPQLEVMWGATSETGRPVDYAYIDDTIRLGPTPDAVYTIRPHAFYKLAALSADNQSNAWTTEAVDLTRESAKYRIYKNILRDAEGAALAADGVRSALETLRAETSARMGTGLIQGTDF
jgi:hypothetical protein